MTPILRAARGEKSTETSISDDLSALRDNRDLSALLAKISMPRGTRAKWHGLWIEACRHNSITMNSALHRPDRHPKLYPRFRSLLFYDWFAPKAQIVHHRCCLYDRLPSSWMQSSLMAISCCACLERICTRLSGQLSCHQTVSTNK